MQKCNFPKKILWKKNQNPSRHCNSLTNLKLQHKPKISSSFKHPHIIKIDLFLLLPSRGQNPLSYYIYFIMNLKTQHPCCEAMQGKHLNGLQWFKCGFNLLCKTKQARQQAR
jgi:hypothetical protein